ncbi:hypothetical protein [Hoeflea sp. TYP-13]|uniref:hypothetical protein n=1 Tax=Hoeflea sp. TYP-13 TaxID=3230023 RepID=UPI0034C60C37
MSFETELTAALDATTASDRSIVCRPTIKVEFESVTVRLWGGIGSLKTPDDERWTGFYLKSEGGELQSLIDIPAIDDVREGTSAPIAFRLGYIDAENYAALRDDETKTDGRPLTIGKIYLASPDSTVALSQPGDAVRLTMVGKPGFQELRRKQDDGSYKFLYSLTVKAVNQNSGRSRVGANLLTYNGHKFRSEIIHGVTNDEYAQFIARYAGGVTLEL